MPRCDICWEEKPLDSMHGAEDGDGWWMVCFDCIPYQPKEQPHGHDQHPS